MRLDLFLKNSKLCTRRAVAQRLCDAGLVLVNESPAKSAHSVKPGDLVTLQRRDGKKKVRILSLPLGRQVSRKEAASLYETLSEESFRDEPREW